MKKWIVYLLVVLFVGSSFLFSGVPDYGPRPLCKHHYAYLNKFMGFPVNCDAFEFIKGAIQPSYLLKPYYSRQGRPGYILLGTVTGYSIYYITLPLHPLIRPALEKEYSKMYRGTQPDDALLFFFVYAGYILINILILIGALYIFEKNINAATGAWNNGALLLLTLLGTLISNQVTRYFFWTVHTQLLNILTPLLCLYIGLHFSKLNSNRKLITLAFFSGLLTFIYGNFLLLLPTIIFCYLYTLKKQGKWNVKQLFIQPGLLAIVFILPSIAWIVFLYSLGIHYYNREIAVHRQFVWVLDELTSSGFSSLIATFYKNSAEFMKTFGSILFTTAFLLITVMLVKRKNMAVPIYKHVHAPISLHTITIAVFAISFTFFWLLGSYADRLTFSLAPILLFFTASYINRYTIKKPLKYFLVSIMILWHFYNVFFEALHFSDNFYH